MKSIPSSLAAAIALVLMNVGTADAQKVTGMRDCAEHSDPARFETPRNTIAYHKFVENLGNNWSSKGKHTFANHYDPQTNEYIPLRIMSFVINGGESYSGKDFPLRVHECLNLTLNEADGTQVFIPRLIATLHWNDAPKSTGAGGPTYKTSMPRDFLRDITQPGKVLAFGRLTQTSSSSRGTGGGIALQRIELEFDFLNYYTIGK